MSQTSSAAQSSRPSAFAKRREFIQLALASVGAAWFGLWLQSRLFPDTGATQTSQPVTFPLADLPVGSAKPITYGSVPALVLRTPESVRAFSLICTHLGCTVEWQGGKKEFYCACHDGRYDAFGDVLAGPPPIPLEQIPVRVEAGTVTVGEV